MDALQQSSYKLAEEMYKNANPQGATGAGPQDGPQGPTQNGPDKGSDNDDFEVVN